MKIDALKDKILTDDNAIVGSEALEKELGVKHHFADGLYAKEIRLPAGSEVIQHAHDYDHLSIFTGTIELTVDDHEETIMTSVPTCLVIKKGKNHGIKALTDVVWYCIHNEETTLWPS